MKIEAKKVDVNQVTMKAEINAADSGKVYIVANGEVTMLPLPAFGSLELPCQNYKVGKPAYRITTQI